MSPSWTKWDTILERADKQKMQSSGDQGEKGDPAAEI
jgi:hypothetical protein